MAESLSTDEAEAILSNLGGCPKGDDAQGSGM